MQLYVKAISNKILRFLYSFFVQMPLEIYWRFSDRLYPDWCDVRQLYVRARLCTLTAMESGPARACDRTLSDDLRHRVEHACTDSRSVECVSEACHSCQRARYHARSDCHS